MDGPSYNTSSVCRGKWYVFVMFCTPGWFCGAQINQQLQRGYIFDGWHVPGVDSGKEKYKKILLQCNNYVTHAIRKKRVFFLYYCLSAVLKFAFASWIHFCFFPSSIAPPMFLPISSTPQPERRQTPQRRHSIEKETPTNVRQFLPPTKHNSKSLVSVGSVSSIKLIIYIWWFSPSGMAVQWLALLPRKKTGCGFSSNAWGPYMVEFSGSPGVCTGSLLALRPPSHWDKGHPRSSSQETNTSSSSSSHADMWPDNV